MMKDAFHGSLINLVSDSGLKDAVFENLKARYKSLIAFILLELTSLESSMYEYDKCTKCKGIYQVSEVIEGIRF